MEKENVTDLTKLDGLAAKLVLQDKKFVLVHQLPVPITAKKGQNLGGAKTGMNGTSSVMAFPLGNLLGTGIRYNRWQLQ